MARPLHSEYGPDTPKKQAARAKSGGVKSAAMLDYSPPQGPTSLGNMGPGLGGDVHERGSQGMMSCPTHTSGGPGIGGMRSKGANRRG
jgi:hypothetical protein